MALKPITQSILQRVEELSGLPVVVQADPAVHLATIKMARGTAPAHLVKYNPAIEATVDYAVCFQSGFVLRMFAVPESDRFDLKSSANGRKEAEAVFAEHLHKTKLPLPPQAVSQLCGQLYSGLILQLRSIPIALRVDAWLRRDCSELNEQQKTANIRQLNDNAACLRPEVRQITPATILHASIAMNAAFASFWSRTWDDPLLIVPYKTSANLSDGQALLKIWDEIPDDPSSDRQLIEAWGNYVKLTGWYDIVAYA